MLFKNLALFLLGSCCAYAVLAQNNSLAVIPQPVKAEKKEGVWILNANTILELDKKNRQVVSIAEYLAARLSPTLGKALPLMQEKESADTAAKRIHLQLVDEARAKWMGTEGYQLDVNASGVTIQALQPAGLFYGVQTLLQLLPKEIESRDRISRTEWELPQCHIEDYPRFGWRGLMLDVSRHFFTK
ncbi:MAG: glycoside hydrolase family 20 zincin-like fold domain-containing protein, partial [Chitinophagaceae bacterium]